MIEYKGKIQELLLAGKAQYEVVKELGCAKSTVSYHALRLNVRKPRTYTIRYCKKCGTQIEKYTPKGRRYCYSCHELKQSAKGKCRICSKEIRSTLGICKSCSISLVRYDTLKKAVEYLGNICYNCRKSYPLAVYDFHHKDPITKRFSLSQMISRCRNWEAIKEELDKCELLCANCHRLTTNTAQGRVEKYINSIPE